MPYIDLGQARINFESVLSVALDKLQARPATNSQRLAAAAEYLNQLQSRRMEIRGLPPLDQDKIDQETLRKISDEGDLVNEIFKRNPRLLATTFYERLYRLPDVNPISIMNITREVSKGTIDSLKTANRPDQEIDLSQISTPSTIFDGYEPQSTDEATKLLKELGLFGNRPKKYGKRKKGG